MAEAPEMAPDGEASESKTEGITVKVTASAKRQAEFVATLHNCAVGPMLYERSLLSILEEFREVQQQLKPEPTEAVA